MKTWMIISLLASFSVFAQDSAQRKENVSWREYAAKAAPVNDKSFTQSALSAARPFKADDYENVTPWSSADLDDNFAKMRDDRFVNWPRDRDFLRRLTWLYPADGCYARAAMANRHLDEAGIAVPKKIFAFGDLKVETAYDEDGAVTWWYHVAQIVDVGGVRYVLDPAINPKSPMKVEDWISAMGDIKEIEVAVCEAGTYVPRSNCATTSVGTSGTSALTSLLSKEWNNLKNLDLDPAKLLGDAPPWN